MVKTEVELTEYQIETLQTLAATAEVPVDELIRQGIAFFLSQQRASEIVPKRASSFSLAEFEENTAVLTAEENREEREEKKRRALSVMGMFNSSLSDLGSNHDHYLEA